MKHLIYAAIALLAFVSCEKEPASGEEPGKNPPEEKDSVTLSVSEVSVDKEGGTAEVTVTSSGDWMLATADDKEYSWVSPSSLSGKSGDKVVFTIEKNDTQQDKTADYVFSSGKAETPFRIILKAGEASFLKLISEESLSLTNAPSTVEVSVETNIPSSSLEISAKNTDGNSVSWLSFTEIKPATQENTLKILFSLSLALKFTYNS